MKIFKEYFEDMETRVERIALLPGGFKPPTKGHFNALRYLLNDADGGADRGIVFIGSGVRDGITPEQSEKIWNIYAKYFHKPVEIVSVPNPVIATYKFADKNLDKKLLVGAGGPREREDGTKDEGDIERYEYFVKNVDKYPLVNVVEIPSQEEGMSGTNVRKEIEKDIEQGLEYFVPKEIITSKDDMQAIEEILTRGN
jgi:hypothetical protein